MSRQNIRLTRVTANLTNGHYVYASGNALFGAPLTTSNVSEVTNLYFTNARSYANTLVAIKTGNGIIYSNTTGNITLSPTGVSASTYGGSAVQPVIVVDAFGRITSVSNVTSTVANTNITGNIISSQITSVANSQITGNIISSKLEPTAVTAATYGNATIIPIITVDQQGRITSASNAQLAAYATNAQLATYATNAQLATYATNAQLATYATNAQLATYATNAQLATYATNAQLATYATNSQLSSYALATSLTTANVSEVTNLYFTNARVYSNVVAAGFYDTVSNTAPINASESGTTLTLSHATSGVSAATYGGAATVPVYVVNATGHITSASNVTIAIASGAVSGLAASATTDTTNASNITSGTLGAARLPTSGVSAATYGGLDYYIPVVAVDSYGRITSASNIIAPYSLVNASEVSGGVNLRQRVVINAGGYLASESNIKLASGSGITITRNNDNEVFFTSSGGGPTGANLTFQFNLNNSLVGASSVTYDNTSRIITITDTGTVAAVGSSVRGTLTSSRDWGGYYSYGGTAGVVPYDFDYSGTISSADSLDMARMEGGTYSNMAGSGTTGAIAIKGGGRNGIFFQSGTSSDVGKASVGNPLNYSTLLNNLMGVGHFLTGAPSLLFQRYDANDILINRTRVFGSYFSLGSSSVYFASPAQFITAASGSTPGLHTFITGANSTSTVTLTLPNAGLQDGVVLTILNQGTGAVVSDGTFSVINQTGSSGTTIIPSGNAGSWARLVGRASSNTYYVAAYNFGGGGGGGGGITTGKAIAMAIVFG